MKSVATKTATVIMEVEKKDTELMLRHSKENNAEISVATKEDYVAIIKILSKRFLSRQRCFMSRKKMEET